MKKILPLFLITTILLISLSFCYANDSELSTFVVVNDRPMKFINGHSIPVDWGDLPFSTPVSTFSVIIYGDSRWGDKVHEKLVTQMLKFKPSVVVHLGDMVNNGCNEKDWEKFYSITAPLRRKCFFQIVKGNHEKPDECYEKHFKLHNYYATFAGIRFVFLDLDLGIDRAKSFLKRVSTDKTIVFMHYPVFTAGPHMIDSIVKKARKLHDLFRKLGIKLIFSSHDHNYQKFRKDGVLYIVTGGGGASLYDILNPFEPLEYHKIHHFVHLFYNGTWMEGRVIDGNSDVIDTFSVYF